ncbi:KTSC domain-containing protein [Flavobacterium sp. GSP6]|uniref:KTSC domain-containing protein n=1 Tax=Flavobacterium sp. GSP6 TaxID=2497488 RepID=UPI000F881DE8|nr:KTSC domain-containing protein [Flavobacterium sp. GSP6]RTZ01967.1 KTSC domain-containing protein [Flavobacterium sp. GSP6]
MALPINIDELLHGNTVEWDRIELKKGWNPEDIIHSLCAYANDINNWDGGYLIIGVEEDNGKAKLPPIGLQVQELDAIQKKLIELAHKLSPVYIPVFQPYLINEIHILVVFAPAGDNRPYKAPISLSEKRTERAMYIKRGSKTVKVKDGSDDERRLIELTARIPFDDRINQTVKLNDLNLRLIQNYLKEVMSSLYEESTKIPFSELCRHLMIAKGSEELLRPTNAGLLLFNENPDKFFSGAKIDLIIHKNEVGKDYTEKIFTGSIVQQIRDVLQYFKTNIVEELVVKSARQAESIRFFNYPFQAIEEAVVNAVYHKSYERENPVEIQIHKDKIEILSFPGPMPPITQAMLNKQRVVARDYRNRKMGGFLKELKLTEGRGTGLPIIHKSLEENGSPPPIFETDENNAYFLCIISIHPLANSILVSQDELRRDEDNTLKINEIKDINRYLSLSVSELGDKDREVIRARINNTIKKILHFCAEPKSNDEIFEKIELYKNTKNHNHHIKPLLEIGWLKQTIPDKPRSKNQKYYTTDLGKKLLAIIAIDSNSGIKRIPVASSNIASVGYDVENKILEIEFHHGAVYQYFDVPEKVYEELINSSSYGAYFTHEIKEKYSYNKIN